MHLLEVKFNYLKVVLKWNPEYFGFQSKYLKFDLRRSREEKRRRRRKGEGEKGERRELSETE